MSRELKVYNEFDELILHAEHNLGDASVRLIDGTREMNRAIKALQGHDFERAAMINGQICVFQAGWDDPDFLDAVAGFWTASFGWRTRIVQKSPKFARAYEDVLISNVVIPNLPDPNPSAAYYAGLGSIREVFSVGKFQLSDLLSNVAYSVNDKFVVTSVIENDQARKPELVVLKIAA
jgi:hypothetical protein